MVNTIVVKQYCSKIVSITKDEHNKVYTWYKLENGQKLSGTEIRKENVLIECHECHEFSDIKFYGGSNGLLNRKYLCLSCVKIAERNPFYGKHHTDEFKKEMSAKRSVEYLGSGNPFHGKHHSEETKMRISKVLIEREVCKGKNNPFYGKKHPPELLRQIGDKIKKWAQTPEGKRQYKLLGILSTIAQSKGRKTTIERDVEKELTRLKVIDFKYSKILEGTYQFDFIIGNKILLEVMGDYWHGNPNIFGNNKKKLNERQLFKINRDHEKKVFAEQRGYIVFYIWEQEIRKKDFSIVHNILQYRREQGV